MKNRPFTTRIFLVAALLLALIAPADAALRSNLFGRRTRSMVGMGDSGAGELFTVTPGARSLRAHLRNASGIGYGNGNGRRFNTTFGRNNIPRSIRGTDGSMTFTGIRGGGMRMLVRNLRGRRMGQPMMIFPGAGILAARGATSTAETFRFTGFDGFGYTREQVLNDPDVFGEPLAKLIDNGFGSFKSFLQKVSAAILLHPEYFEDVGETFVTYDVEEAAGGILSDFPTGEAQSIVTSPIDLVSFFDPILRALEDEFGEPLLSNREIRIIERFIEANSAQILQLLYEYALLTGLFEEIDSRPVATYEPVDASSPGTLEFAQIDTAVLENAGSTFVYVYRNGGSLGEASVTIDVTANGDAVQPTDFRFTQQTVTWADGESGPKAVYFKVTDDTVEELDPKVIQLAITAFSGGSYGDAYYVNISIVDNDGAAGTSGFATAENSLLVCEYSWGRNQRDLDTFTSLDYSFSGSYYPLESVGFTSDGQYRFGDYMGWSGDDRNSGGKEVVVIDTENALADFAIGPDFRVSSQADWYDVEGSSGPATLTVYFIDKFTGRTSEKATATIEPGIYSITEPGSHATTFVGETPVSLDLSGILQFTLYPAL